MNNWLKNNQLLNKALVGNLFKQSCFLCAAPVDAEIGVCTDCLQDLPHAPSPSCPQCGLETNGVTCGNCLKSAPYYDKTHALFSYAYPVDAIIQHYKYNHALYLSQTLGSLLQASIEDDDIDVIIPMPLHPSRIKERGFNQSLEIAKVIAKEHNIQLDSTNCHRVRNTQPQASLALKERINNMKGAFDCQATFTGMHIMLVDDVMSTGASLNELAKTLKKSGAEKVSCYVLARAV